MQELHQYGRLLITDKKPKEALEIFKNKCSKKSRAIYYQYGPGKGLFRKW
jgi:hypothetical protein